MKQYHKEIIAGIILTVVLGGLLSFVHSRSVVADSGDEFILHASFTKADGIVNGSDVRLAGIKVGTVTHQSLNNAYAVRVKMAFDKYIALSIDTSATIETDGFFGTKYIELVPGGDEELLMSGDDLSYTQDALILTELMDTMMAYMRNKNKQPEQDKEILNSEDAL